MVHSYIYICQSHDCCIFLLVTILGNMYNLCKFHSLICMCSDMCSSCHSLSKCTFLYKYGYEANTTFVNYLDHFPNLTETLRFPIIMNKTTFKQTLPTSFKLSKFDSNLLTAFNNLKDFIHQYTHKKEIFDLKERQDNMTLIINKYFFSDNYVMNFFSVYYYNNFYSGCSFDNIFIM